MLWLPAAQLDGRDVRFPLAEATAAQLLTGAGQAISGASGAWSAFAEAAQSDALFCAWIVLKAGEVLSPSAAAAWLESHWHGELTGCEWREASSLRGENQYLSRNEALQQCSAAAGNMLPAWVRSWLREETPRELPLSRKRREGDSPSRHGAWPAMFPLQLTHLARLRELETEFAAALEREKIAAVREFAYGAGHEINNPLANISTRAQTLLRQETDPERRRRLAVINGQAFRAHEMIADLMLFAKPPAIEAAAFDAVALLREIIAECAAEAADQGTEIELRAAHAPLSLTADRAQLGAAVKGLCRNALEALGRGGKIEIEAAFDGGGSPGANGNRWLHIIVRDTGPGISPAARPRIFDPYYSGREAGRGLGFGLPKAWTIVTRHGGSIEVESPPTGGAAVTLRVPLVVTPSGV